MSASTLSGIFILIIIIESSPFLVDDNPENQCVLRDVKCKPALQRPCCNPNDYCKQMDSEDSFKCTEKNLKPELGRFCEIHEDCDGIWHSKCSKNKCVCREKNVKYNDTVCAPILGGFCWKNEICVTENSVCIDQECQCKENHTQILNKCIFNVLGTHCENDETCQQVKFAKCATEKICTCPPSVLQVNQYCKSPMDGFCWSDDDCSISASICVDNKCQCEDGMVFYTNRCVKVFMNMPCVNHRECSSHMPFSKCSPSDRCTCEAYYSDHIGRCVPNPVNLCSTNYSCQVLNTFCNKHVCECEPGFVYRHDVCFPISLEDSCINNYSCHPIPNAICSIDKKCECAENHLRMHKSSCIPVLGGNCKNNTDCIVVDSICSNLHCQCKPGFVNRTKNECIFVGLGINCRYDDDCRAIKNSKCSEKKICECIENSVKINSTVCFPIFGTRRRLICLNNNNYRPDDDSKTHKNKYKQSYKKIECKDDDDCAQISNAKCIDYTCSCREHYAMISNTTCAPLLGQYCQLLEQCATPKSECIDKKCQCEEGYVNYFNNICVSNAGNFGISCKSDYYCINYKYAECSYEKKCACKSNYVALGDDQCVALIGEYCDSDSECISYNTVCVDHKCECPKKFVMRSKYQCDRSCYGVITLATVTVATITMTTIAIANGYYDNGYHGNVSLGKTCKQDYDCQIAMNNSLCSKDKVCVCKENHYALNNYECVPYLYEKCTTDYDCHFNFSACIDNQCQCTVLHRSVSFNRCELFGSLYSCEKNIDCGDPWHNICSKDRKCICNNNNTYIDKSTCSPLLGGYCWTDHQCIVRNSICVDFHCKCRGDFRPISSNMCMPVKP